MTVNVYECEDGSITAVTPDNPNLEQLIGPGVKLLRTIVEPDWESCMVIHHQLMGWEPYKPF